MDKLRITDNLELLLAALPQRIQEALMQTGRSQDLIEIVMDLGRLPEARFTVGEMILSDQEITEADINTVIEQIGAFGEDNRAGIERTLHRISAMRNRKGQVIGVTCRVGRAVYGTIQIIADIVTGGKSILLVGRPGVGKTTLLREAARVLGESKRVVIVDTSNEIAGDGDIPHPAIGRARRMQVPRPDLQHEVMIEAVENHMPEAIVIDEIGRELEAVAARTIAERGLQLIGTAHGNALENLLLNPTLSDLVGGIESVTLSDEEARRRGTQKTVLERRSPPTFDVLIEIQDRQRMVIHHDVAGAVDALLRGWTQTPELRYTDESGQVHIEAAPQVQASIQRERGGSGEQDEWGERSGRGGRRGSRQESRSAARPDSRQENRGDARQDSSFGRGVVSAPPAGSNGQKWPSFGEVHGETYRPTGQNGDKRRTLKIFPYGIGQNRLRSAAKTLDVNVEILAEMRGAEVVMTLKNYYRQQPQPLIDAERRNIPVYVLRSNTVTQMEQCLVDIFQINTNNAEEGYSMAIRETQEAIQRVANGAESAELSPQSAIVRSQQHQLARSANLISHSYGREPHRRVRIFRE